ncbi:hypothetical protein D3C86_2075940 [compost metagenome]
MRRELSLICAMVTPLAKFCSVYSWPRRRRPSAASGRQALAKRQEPTDAPINERSRGTAGNHSPNKARSSP